MKKNLSTSTSILSLCLIAAAVFGVSTQRSRAAEFYSTFRMLVTGSAQGKLAPQALSGPKSIPGDYATLADAITDLNTQGVGAGGVTFNLMAGNPQTAPAGGYVIGGAGSLVLTTASAANPIVFNGNGNIITAPTPQASGALNDGIFKLIGADWVTIQNFTMLENPANTITAAGTNNMTEWGVALLYVTTTDGAQNDTIQNNTIDLDRTYQNTFGIYSNSTHTATAVTVTATATGAAGGNDNLKVYNNNITDVNIGIVHVGPTAAADQNPTVDIGGVALATGNTITNFGTTGTFSGYANVSGTVNGILVRNTKNFNVSFNTVSSSNGGTTVGTLNGIQVPASSNAPTGTLTQTINNNSISLRPGATGIAINGINMPSGSVNATTTSSINNNDFNTFGHTVAGGTGAITFITHLGNPLTQNINSNTFTNISVNTTGTITFFSFAQSLISGATLSISGNSVVTGFTRTGAGTTTVWTTNASSVNGSSHAINNNNFSNFTLTGASAFNGITDTDGASSVSGPTKSVNGNTFNNINTGAGTVVPMSVNFSGPGTTVNTNTISNVTTTNSITCLTLGSSNQATITASGNLIDPITSGGAAVNAISVASLTAVISKNKIYDLSGTAAGSVVSGIAVTSATASSTVTLSNNLVGNLTAPAATGSNAVIGINITGLASTSTFNVFYNTVYLNNTTSGAGFGSSGISTLASATATTSTLNLRNNIIVNTSVQNGAGVTVAYRRSAGGAGTLANYAGASNNNDFYAGTPSATNLIYSDGTSSAQTMSAYKNGVFTAGTIAPRDSASFSENPPFLSTTGSSAMFLHINSTIPTQLESGATPIGGITDDFDGDARNVSTPDVGADEFGGIILDITAPLISYTPLANGVVAGSRSFTNVTIMDATGVNITAGIRPRVYYKKSTDSNDLAATGWKFVEASGAGGSPFSFTIDYTQLNGGSVSVGDTIQYFVVAQDTAGMPNVGINSGTFFMQPSSVALTGAAFPIGPTINSYNISDTISGTKTLCSSGCDYASLTNSGGVFADMNAKVLNGNVIIQVTSDLTGETGANALNAPGEQPAGSNFTITIMPTGAARSITGSATGALIRMNGASRVTIDGSIGGGGTDRSLTIENTSVTTPSVVLFGSTGTTPITNDTLKNCVVRNGVNTSSAVVISDAGTLGNPGFFSNITIQNNDVQKAFVGVFANGGTTPQNGSNLTYTQNAVNTSGANAVRNVALYMQGVNGATVSNNTVGNLDKTNDENDVGIWLASGTINATVAGNTIATLGYTGTAGFAPIGINLTPAAVATNNNVTGNSVSDISSNGTTAVRGISVSGASADLTIQKNNVQGVINTNTGTFGAYGMDISAGNNIVVKNNFVSNVSFNMTGGAAFSTTFGIFGIRVFSGTGHQIYNNSVNLYGALPGTPNTNLLSAAFGLISTGSTGCDVRNNIFANNITGGTTSIAHVSVYLPSGGTSAMNLTWNNNAYYFGADAARQGAGQAGSNAGTTFFTTFDPTMTTPATNLRSYTSTLSLAGTNDNASLGFTSAVPFLANNDLHLPATAGAVLGGATPLGSVTNDIDMDPRPAANPDIGADELVQALAGSIGPGTFYNVSANDNDALGGDVTVTNMLTLNGKLLGSGSTLTIGCNASISGAGPTNYVIGNLKKTYCGAGSFNFVVGTANGFSPVSVNITAGTFPADFTAKATQGPQPNLLSPTHALQRYWTLTATGVTADLTFNYLDPTDIPAMATEASFVIFKYDGAFTMPGGSVNTAANTASVTGVTTFSDWTLAEPGAPTDVALNSFTADGYAGTPNSPNGGVLLKWQTGLEVANLGFNIYRDEAGKRVRVAPGMIAGSALFVGARTVLGAGRSYVWRDTQGASADAQYWLESVDINGFSTWYGPVRSSGVKKASAPFEPDSKLLRDLGEDTTAGDSTTAVETKPKQARMSATQLAIQAVTASQPAVKIAVQREGWYRITQAELTAAGLDPRVAPIVLQLTADGQEQPMNVLTGKDGRVSAIEFYGVGPDSPYTSLRTYWLAAGEQPGKRIEQVKSAGTAAAGSSFLYAVERRDRTVYFSALRNGDKENFFGAVIARDAVDQSLNVQRLDAAASAATTLEVALQGVTTVAHSVNVELNGSSLGLVSFSNQLGGVGRFNAPPSLLREGQNVVRLTSQGGQGDVSLVDYIRLTYPHGYTADGDALRFTGAGRQQVTIDGFSSSDIRVLDVTNPGSAQELVGAIQPQKSGYSVALNLQGTGQRTLLAIAGQMAKPASLTANIPSSWRQPANGADLIIITRRDFFTALDPLRSLRQKQGYSVALVDIEDVYDEFSYGQKTPQAVKDFCAYAGSNWKKAPRFVMLAGDASLDPKNYLGFGDSDFVPTRLVDTQLMETASDDWFVDFNGDGLPDMAIGRLPARSADEASRLASKIAGYDVQPSTRSLLLASDHNDTYDFEGASSLLRGLIPPSIRVETVDRAHLDDATAKAMLIDAINRGQIIVNYTGHGSVDQWRGNILTSGDAAGLTNSGKLSLFVMMTCLNGYFQDAALDSLAESLLKADGGAVAVWGSSGMTTPDLQSILNQQAYRLIFSGTPVTIGEATARAKAAVASGDVRRTWILLGDPMTVLR